MSKVYLVGAGPGDPNLITLKGLKLIEQCDCIIYDRLSSYELLSHTSNDCEKIYVGKEPGRHYRKQEEINEIIVDAAGRHDIVVRLKGGDPFVFGRGGEEIEKLIDNDIAYEVVPGITSAIAVPLNAGIPVTHREVARSFHVITGHRKDDELLEEIDFANLADTEGTLIFLMGLSNLSTIVKGLIDNGKPHYTPATVISEGTTVYEKTVRGTLSDIVSKVREEGIKSPAVIVIGDTAAKNYHYDEYSDKAISFDKKDGEKIVGVTATASLYRKISDTFAKEGVKTALLCDMEVVPDKEAIDSLKGIVVGDGIKEYTWILFTSRNAVTLFFEMFLKERIDYRVLSGVKFAVLGEGTKQALGRYGFSADFIPSKYTLRTLCCEFENVVNVNDKILIPRAKQGSEELKEWKNRWKAKSTVIEIYDVRGRGTEHFKHLRDMSHLVFASASGVTAFMNELKERDISIPSDIKKVCIGEVTSSRLKNYGECIDAVSSVQSVDGLLRAIKDL